MNKSSADSADKYIIYNNIKAINSNHYSLVLASWRRKPGKVKYLPKSETNTKHGNSLKEENISFLATTIITSSLTNGQENGLEEEKVIYRFIVTDIWYLLMTAI